jgi:hypothetical protein
MTDELSKVMQDEAKPEGGTGEPKEATGTSEPTVDEKFEAYKKKTDAENRNLRRERNELREKVSKLEAGHAEAHEKLKAVEQRERDQALTQALGLDTRRAPLSAVKSVLEEAGIEPVYGEGSEVLNSAEMRTFLSKVWAEKFGHGSADGGSRQPRPGVAPATMSEYLRGEYKRIRGRRV